MVLQAKRSEEVSLYVYVALRVGCRQTQSASAQHH